MIRLCEPTFTQADRDRIETVLTTGQMIQGRFVAEFEALAAEWLGCDVIACSSGTAALHLALLALGLVPGDEVLVPAFTWPSTAHVIVQSGLVPVFVDVDSDTLCVTADAMRRAVGPRTRAMLPVHLFGATAPMRELLDLAATHGLRIVEDAACSIGSRVNTGDWSGTVGDIGCFSLHPRKTITTGEGGLLATRDAKLAARLRLLRNHGMERTEQGILFTEAGLNYRLGELGGALGVGQMQQLADILQMRRSLTESYIEQLSDLPVHVPHGIRNPDAAVQSFVVDLAPAAGDLATLPAWRHTIMASLRDAGVETTIGTYCVTDQPVYEHRALPSPQAFPGSRHLARALMTLPLHHRMNADDVHTVVCALKETLASIAPLDSLS
jgi:perosamine synthetase